MESVRKTVVFAIVCMIVGCAQTGPGTTRTATTGAGATADPLSERQADLDAREARLKQAEADLRARENRMSSAMESEQSIATMADVSLFPPDPRPGECYARVIIPAKYETTTENVLKREASERIEIVPATYTTEEESVLVREASTKLEIIPAEYEVVTERVMIKPASQKIVEVPAKYETKVERILDKPAHTVWKRGTDVTGKSSAAVSVSSVQDFIDRTGATKIVDTRVDDTGEIMCLVEVPATYKTVKTQVLVSPATTEVIDVPAEYGSVEKRVVKRPATTRELTIPAEYKTMKVSKIMAPSKENRIPVPAEYEVVTKSKKVTEEAIEWRPVLCQVNMTTSNVRALQTALKQEGCYECSVDGVIGPCTYRAAQCYAERKGLPSGSNYVTTQVIKTLGLNLN